MQNKLDRENMLKERLAEALIEELFLDLGFHVYRYGSENNMPGIKKRLLGVKDYTANTIRNMPDFVIQHPENKATYFIEVKFRSSGSFNKSDIKDYPHRNCFFIVFSSKKDIKCLSYEELCRGEEISPISRNYLGNRKEFALDESSKEIIIQYCDFAEKFYSEVQPLFL